MGRGYISLKVDKKHAHLLGALLKVLKINNGIPPKDMHMTLVYDKRNPDILHNPPTTNYNAKILDVKTLGPKDSKYKAMVLTVHDPKITTRHKTLLKDGFEHSYPELIQHISLKYHATENDLLKLKKCLNIIKALLPTIRLGNEKISHTDD